MGLATLDKPFNISVILFKFNTSQKLLTTLKVNEWWKEPTSHLKINYLNQKGENMGPPQQTNLNLSLFTLNFISVDEQDLTAVDRFWTPQDKKFALVRWKDPLMSLWQGTDPVLIWGRGHVCVFPKSATSPRWLPE